jgi:hypothetical protein
MTKKRLWKTIFACGVVSFAGFATAAGLTHGVEGVSIAVGFAGVFGLILAVLCEYE